VNLLLKYETNLNNSYFLIETRSLLSSQLFFLCRLSHSLHCISAAPAAPDGYLAALPAMSLIPSTPFFLLLTFGRALLIHPMLFRLLSFAFARICAKFRGREQFSSSLTYAHKNDVKHGSSDLDFEFRAG
jgi:hypothetical protein